MADPHVQLGKLLALQRQSRSLRRQLWTIGIGTVGFNLVCMIGTASFDAEHRAQIVPVWFVLVALSVIALVIGHRVSRRLRVVHEQIRALIKDR